MENPYKIQLPIIVVLMMASICVFGGLAVNKIDSHTPKCRNVQAGGMHYLIVGDAPPVNVTLDSMQLINLTDTTSVK